MAGTQRSELKTRLAAEFDKQGWEWDLAADRALGKRLASGDVVDGDVLAGALPGEFFSRNRTTRLLVAAAIDRAIGGRTVQEETTVPTTLVIGGNNYHVNIGEGAMVANSSLNVGEGTQIVIESAGSRDDVLTGVEALVRAGLTGDWSTEAANALNELVASLSDISADDVQRVTTEVVLAQQPSQGRAKSFLATVGAHGLGGSSGKA